jgi:hypothetical protein
MNGPSCLLLVVGTIQVNATSKLEIARCPNVGLTSLPEIYTVALVE